MRTVIIVSKCIKTVKLESGEIWYQFHFKGAYQGEILKSLLLKGKEDRCITKGREYLIYVRVIACVEGVLRGSILKQKPLEECWERS